MNYRFKHHPPTSDAVINAHQAIRIECDFLFEVINASVPEGHERSIAVTKVEEAMMWANAGIARNQ